MTYLLDDFASADQSRFGTSWFLITDEELGGDSSGDLQIQQADSEPSVLKLSGSISTEKGFIQAALPLIHSRYLFDARHFSGMHLVCRSLSQNPDSTGYYLQLRTRELSMPWQHYRAAIQPGHDWSELQIPFSEFKPISTTHELNLERLSRVGIVAGLQVFNPDLQLAEIGFY